MPVGMRQVLRKDLLKHPVVKYIDQASQKKIFTGDDHNDAADGDEKQENDDFISGSGCGISDDDCDVVIT